jgi:transposase
MRYKTGIDKKQISLLPATLDDYVPEDHICRVIDAFTVQLDMAALGYKYAECKSTGCRPYDPRMMLNLYIYGYLHRVRSSRRLRDEASRNIEAMWLMQGLKPDDKTICNFRKDNAAALKKTFREFAIMCRELGLYGRELGATDGTKVRADNSLKHNHNRVVVENELSRIDRKIGEYMEALEQADGEEEGTDRPSGSEIRAALEKLRQRRDRAGELHKRGQEEGEVSTVDSEARLMRTGGEGRKLDVCYNMQVVADSEHHLIVDFEVTNCSNDSGNLHAMSEKAKDILGVDSLTNLADKGYYNGEAIAACEGNGVTCLVAKPRPGGAKKAKEFSHERFMYDRDNDLYVCPCQARLPYMRDKKASTGKEYRVYANYAACGECLRKAECTAYKYREILRLPYQDVLDAVEERTKKNKGLYRRRQEIVEHIFGTIKAVWGYRQFLCRGMEKVAAETALSCLAYNMRRAFNVYKEKGLKLAVA